MMTVSRLLKSWAMPPVSWPTASIFCDWRSVSSASRRSFASASSRSTKCCVERTISAASPIAEARQRPISPSTQVRNVRASAWRTASSLLSSATNTSRSALIASIMSRPTPDLMMVVASAGCP